MQSDLFVWVALYEEHGVYNPTKEKQTRTRKIVAEELLKAVEEKPDAYLHELAEIFDCTPQAISYALKKFCVTYKKTFTYSEKSAEKRAKYLEEIRKTDSETVVYVDETGVDKYLQREHGRALRGKKVEDTKRG